MSEKIKVTYSNYDDFVNSLKDFPATFYWPKENHFQIFEKDPERFIMFLIFLSEYGKKPETDEQRKSKKMLNQFLINHLELVD